MFLLIKNKIRQWSDRSYLGGMVFLFIRNFVAKSLSILPDAIYAQWFYRLYTGKRLNLDNPQLFDEKIWWLKLHNRDPLLTKCSDKNAVRNYVAEMGYSDILIPSLGVYSSVNEINFEQFNQEVIIKSTSGSGENRFFSPADNPNNIVHIKRYFNYVLKLNPFWYSREWNYKDIPRKIIVEKVLRDSNCQLPIDYKFLCFDGEPKLLFLDIGLIDNNKIYNHKYPRNIYDMDFNLLPVRETRDNYPDNIDKPANFEDMKKIAKDLSTPFPFCRVDLYNLNGHIYFGEITFYHGGGCNNIEPIEWDYKIASWINLSSPKITL